MAYIFSEEGRAILNAFMDRTILFAFDFDGTLAPIADHPDSVRLSDGIRSRLIRLNRIARIAVITGRARDDVLTHLGFSPRFLIGNHGAEGLPGEEEREDGYRLMCSRWEAQLRFLLALDDPGILFENKGTSLSLHYRHAKDVVRTRKDILDAADRLTPPPRRVAGKFVENLMVPDSPDKGQALLHIMQHLQCDRALFVGDDVTDEDVFRLTQRQGNRIFGIRVGDGTSAAQAFIQGQDEMERLLSRIIQTLEEADRICRHPDHAGNEE